MSEQEPPPDDDSLWERFGRRHSDVVMRLAHRERDDWQYLCDEPVNHEPSANDEPPLAPWAINQALHAWWNAERGTGYDGCERDLDEGDRHEIEAEWGTQSDLSMAATLEPEDLFKAWDADDILGLDDGLPDNEYVPCYMDYEVANAGRRIFGVENCAFDKIADYYERANHDDEYPPRVHDLEPRPRPG